MLYRVVFVAILCVVSAISCVSDQAHRYYAEKTYPPKAVDEVDVLYDLPTRPHEIIADFQARGASVKYIQRKAAEIGADAVIVGMYGGYRAKRDEWASNDTQSKTYTRITGTALIYRR